MLQTKYNILTVDDHPFTTKILTKILQKQGYNVQAFNDPLQAHDFLVENGEWIDLIVSDMMMQPMSGIEFLIKIKELPTLARIPFVFLSAANDDNLRREAFELGAMDYFDKPVNTNLFISKIQSILKNIALNHLSSNILLTGDREMLTPTEIIEYCDMEKLSGYAYFQNSALETTLFFTNGVLDHAGEDRDLSKEFDMLQEWKDYTFLISRGKLNLHAVRGFLKSDNSTATRKTVSFEKFKKIFNQYPGLLEIYIHLGSWRSVRGEKDHQLETLLTQLYRMNNELGRDYGRKVSYNCLQLTDGRRILMLYYHNYELAFLFNDEKDYKALLKMWRGN